MTRPHLVIDARLYGTTHTGIGRYTQNLIIHLHQNHLLDQYRTTIIGYPKLIPQIQEDTANSYHYLPTSIRHYSLSEQLFFPFILYHLRPSLVHFTHFNEPLLYFGQSLITIHDLIKHFSSTPDTSTHILPIFWLKHLAYRFIVYLNITTNHLIVPSNFWRQIILSRYHILSTRIQTIYEAVDPHLLVVQKLRPAQKYLVYIGNFYPHKNIHIILSALTKLPNFKLKIIGKTEAHFFSQLKTQISRLRLQSQVEFTGYLTDTQLGTTLSSATALVHPSFLEGFSLTGLEAMAQNCPVIAANASCLPEIYQDAALYFDPHQSDELVNQIKKLSSSPRLRQTLIKKGRGVVKKYSWSSTARQTASLYQDLIG